MSNVNAKLKELRSKIDKIDTKILELLDKRFKLAFATLKFKRKVSDPSREKEIFRMVVKKSSELKFLQPKFAKKIISTIISESKRIQKRK